MKEAFKKSYERELQLLKERAALFAQDYPGLATRLGGLLEENLDPAIAGLLEGSAFLAARVQLNIDQQFRTFSREMLEQLCPDAAAPLPSAMMVQAATSAKPDDLVQGLRLDALSYLEATFSQADRRVNCRFRLAEPITIWPVEIADARYHDSATPLTAMGIEPPGPREDSPGATAAGLAVTLRRTDGKALSDLLADDLTVTFAGPMREAMALYEQSFCHLVRVTLRWEDGQGDPVIRRVPLSIVDQIGFDPRYPLFGRDDRLFPGFSTLIEYFAFPRKFLGLRLCGLRAALRAVPAPQVQVVFEFNRADPHLAKHFDPKNLRLFCAPAVNLFEDEAKPIALNARHHRFPVAPNRTPVTQFEVQRIERVRVQYESTRDKVDALPLYALPASGQDPRQAVYFTTQTERRALSQQERRMGGTQFRYEGTETWITIYEPPEGTPASHLFVSTLLSNRHLPEVLPVADATFHLIEDRSITLRCVGGPSAPREAMAEIEREGPHRMQAGDNYWRLISVLSLSQRGFLGRDGRGNIEALRELLRLFSDASDRLTEAQIAGLQEMTAEPSVRTVRRPEGYLPARGTRITLTFDEAVFETAAMVCLSAVLDRFFADHASVNSFTECAVRTRKGKIVKTWPPRGGSGPLL